MGTLSILAQWTGTTLFDCNCTFITHTTARNTCIYDAIAMTYLVRDVIIIIHKWAAVLVFKQILACLQGCLLLLLLLCSDCFESLKNKLLKKSKIRMTASVLQQNPDT